MREQYTMKVSIGYGKENPAFDKRVIEMFATLAGGCTVYKADGYWREDGDQHKFRFSGHMHKEHALIVEISVETAKWDSTLDTVQYGLPRIVRDYGIITDWVHVTKTEVTGHHFSCKEALQ